MVAGRSQFVISNVMGQSSVVRGAGQTRWTVWTVWTVWTGQGHSPAPHDSQNNHNRDGCATF